MKCKALVAVVLAMVMSVLPVCAADMSARAVDPRFQHASSVELIIGFDTNNVVHGTLSVVPYSSAAGVSGTMKLYDASGRTLAVWPVSDYSEPFVVENTYQGQHGATYTLYFKGYVYGRNNTAADPIELQVTGTCR